MKIKKFDANTFSEALGLVKKEMGEDAIILSSEERKGGKRGVTVTAAVDYDAQNTEHRTLNTEHRTQNTDITGFKSVLSSEMPVARPSDISYVMEELSRLRESIESMRSSGYELALPHEKKGIRQFLIERAIGEEFALSLCKKADNLNEIPSLITTDIKTRQQLINNKKAIMLIGPTGVGKTTTIAKLAACAIKDGKSAAIVSLDTYRIGAIEQMRIYARIMGIPMDIAASVNELRQSLAKYSGKDIIFIDTTGRNPSEESYINEIKHICDTGFSIEVHLLMSVNSDYDFMAESHKHYSKIPIDCIAFTKADEAVKFGSIYNLSVLYKKPIAYITTGQRVPGDIELPSNERIAEVILKKASKYQSIRVSEYRNDKVALTR
ncbi:MAG: flagellar biosynthesis protein FlhF [Nitrospirae bacterium]|nr:flagellar biosynthesis protein FlhF [Nitrospirota bacterium]